MEKAIESVMNAVYGAFRVIATALVLKVSEEIIKNGHSAWVLVFTLFALGIIWDKTPINIKCRR